MLHSIRSLWLPSVFSRLDVTFATLFWSLFGISSPKSTDLEEEHGFIETVGQGLFMAYHVMSIIVLINMLIAMMSNSFQQIEVLIDTHILYYLFVFVLHMQLFAFLCTTQIDAAIISKVSLFIGSSLEKSVSAAQSNHCVQTSCSDRCGGRDCWRLTENI